MSKSTGFDDRVRREAYRLWEEAGQPHGRDTEFWHQARALVERETVGHETFGHETGEHAASVPDEMAAPLPEARKQAAAPAAKTEAKKVVGRKVAAKVSPEAAPSFRKSKKAGSQPANSSAS